MLTIQPACCRASHGRPACACGCRPEARCAPISGGAGTTRFLILFALLTTLPNTQAAAAELFRLDPDHTFAHFAVVHTGISSVRGRMGIVKGSASLDTAQQSAQVEVELDPGSIDTGVKRLDAALVDEMFFNVARYKSARFSGRAVEWSNGVPVAFEGELTLHGTTRPVHLSAERFACKQVKILVLERFICGGDLKAVLLRSEFGLDKYLSMVSDEVRLTISVEAIREDR